MASMLARNDEYCERIDAGFWSEPVNAITNFAIIIAGLMALRLYHRSFPLHGNRHRPSVLLLVLLVVLTGIGSFLYHTFAQVWAAWADLLPIGAFIYAYHAVFLRRILAFRYIYITQYVFMFFLFSFLLMKAYGPETLNGSIGYLPALISFFVVWTFMYVEGRPGTRLFGATAVIFLVSVFFRTIDQEICAMFPLGTHFLWHLLNSVVLYCLLKLVIQLPNFYQRQQREVEGPARKRRPIARRPRTLKR
jgi:hypothetical protein